MLEQTWYRHTSSLMTLMQLAIHSIPRIDFFSCIVLHRCIGLDCFEKAWRQFLTTTKWNKLAESQVKKQVLHQCVLEFSDRRMTFSTSSFVSWPFQISMFILYISFFKTTPDYWCAWSFIKTSNRRTTVKYPSLIWLLVSANGRNEIKCICSWNSSIKAYVNKVSQIKLTANFEKSGVICTDIGLHRYLKDFISGALVFFSYKRVSIHVSLKLRSLENKRWLNHDKSVPEKGQMQIVLLTDFCKQFLKIWKKALYASSCSVADLVCVKYFDLFQASKNNQTTDHRKNCSLKHQYINEQQVFGFMHPVFPPNST